MSGCALDAFEMVPRSLLTHLGDALGIEVPTVTSVQALYRRRATLFEHQRWAAEMLEFRPTSEHQRRTLTGLIKQESYKALSAAQLVTFARSWCYERKLLIPGERTLNDLVRTANPQAEQELLDAVERGIEAALERLRSDGYEVRPEDVARLSPLPNHHVNVLGRYSFALSAQVANGGMRPLRRPDDDDGWPLA
jgi:hypothetical protein